MNMIHRVAIISDYFKEVAIKFVYIAKFSMCKQNNQVEWKLKWFERYSINLGRDP